MEIIISSRKSEITVADMKSPDPGFLHAVIVLVILTIAVAVPEWGEVLIAISVISLLYRIIDLLEGISRKLDKEN